jgi:Major Facilitator Superfamily
LNAVAGAASEGLGTAVVADLFFLHERGRWMATYVFFLINGVMFGTIVSGFTITNLGWRWVFHVSSRTSALTHPRSLEFWPEWDFY